MSYDRPPKVYFPRREKMDSIIAQHFSVSLMSNAKWVRLLHALTGYSALPENPEDRMHSWDVVSFCRVKLVWDDDLVRTLSLDHRVYNFDYYDHAVEGMISGSPAGWYAYKEIEWIEFLRDGSCDVAKVETAIRRAGQFALEERESALRLYAYQK
jgi:hypothetical protein